MLAPVKAGRRNSVRSSIGRRWRCSTTRNSTSSTAAPIRNARILVEPQPFSLPWMSAKTSRNSDPENVTSPTQSTPVAFGSRDSLTWLSVTNTARHADRHVDEEDPFPADARGDDAADHRADRDGGADDAAEHPEGGAAVLAVEGLGDQRQRGREHHRPADALHARGRGSASAGSRTGRRAPRRT